MKQLEQHYQGEKTLTKAQKFKIVRSAKIIQRWIRLKIANRKVKAAIIIQTAFRRKSKYSKRKIIKTKLLQNQSVIKIQKAVRTWLNKKHTKVKY